MTVEREERVVLVDEADRELGSAEKMAVHASGLLHRAFSILVFDGAGRVLLQHRARAKYHSGGLWSNACCGHPRPGEPLADAAARRLREEMGIGCPLAPASVLRYTARLDGGLIENELDHLLVGRWTGSPRPDPAEAEGWTWADPGRLRARVASHPEEFTVWFRLIVERGLGELARGG